MPTIIGFRESVNTLMISPMLIIVRRFFPSTEPEADSDWEEVEGGESAENGPAAKESEEDTNTITLPKVPTGDPVDEGPATKKQKPDEDEKL